MGFRINKKNLRVTKILPPKDHPGQNMRLRYMRVDPKGTACVTNEMIARVSLPEASSSPATILSEAELSAINLRSENDDIPYIDSNRPAQTGPHFVCPNLDQAIPDVNENHVSIVVNGAFLRKLVELANSVSEDSERLCAVRIYPDKGVLRIDNYREPGQQEFLGVLRDYSYHGNKIPGGKDATKPVVEVRKQRGLLLKSSTGRKFRA